MRLQELRNVIRDTGNVAIAVSGGIDSLTLAVVACRERPGSQVFHAASPAVPKDATERVRNFAEVHDWRLHIIDAGEFSDNVYRDNPINRCFYCKSNLYGTLSRASDLPICSGTNLDDLSDYRPGLKAAELRDVRHPYVEAHIDKDGIRQIARHLGLEEIAELPSAPCLSSRVTTGIRIDAEDLRVIDRVESAAKKDLLHVVVRCRLTENGFHLEIGETSLSSLSTAEIDRLLISARSEMRPDDRLVGIRPYKRGSAFVQ